MHHTCICKGKEVIPGVTPQSTIQQSAIKVVETPNETRVMYSSQQSHDILLKTATAPVVNNEQEVECTTVAKRRPEDTSQWLIQSRSHMNPFEENFQGINLLPRPSERTHPQLVDSRSQIDTGKELATHKENYRLVKLSYVAEEISMNGL
ncbi:Hypothetical predicted protein [Mytilus galloprovincialis]|uniref:Uncharacterized protein n=1 Tax=Mytilus galloprovincialis TaxID=29158 RepID=A0A8B6HHW4_MYTGA|nr:Hypothetical predicted protein [Mytilus galloprovincialis]